MKYIEPDKTHEYKPLPAWHYSGMDGTPLWFSRIHWEVITERFRRIEADNSTEELAMRFCHNCECPIGVMGLDDYKSKHIFTEYKCTACGKNTFDEVLEYRGME